MQTFEWSRAADAVPGRRHSGHRHHSHHTEQRKEDTWKVRQTSNHRSACPSAAMPPSKTNVECPLTGHLKQTRWQ